MTFSRTIGYACLTIALSGLSACDDATATPKPEDAVEPKPVTRAECLAKDAKADKLACLKILSDQRKVELAEAQRRLEAEKARREELDKETERLFKDFEKDVLDED